MKIRIRTQRGPARPFAALALVVLLGAIPARADAGILFFYKFTPVADTKGGFPYQSLNSFPTMNGSGRVAFIATLTGGNVAVMSRLGTGAPLTLADLQSGSFSFFGSGTSINPVNTILFTAVRHTNDGFFTDLMRGEVQSATKLITAPGADVDSICPGAQINVQKTVVFRGTRADGRNVILAAGSGDLTGPVRAIATEGTDFTSLACAPSIDSDGKVAFMGSRNGHAGIFTISPPPQSALTVIVDDSGTFAGFTDVALNRQGGVAFGAHLQGSGARVVERLQNGVLTKVGDTSAVGGAISLNESGQVVYEVIGQSGTSVVRGPGNLFGRIVGPGSVVLGRTVVSANIDRDSFNSTGQVAVLLTLSDNTQMIARGDPVRSDILVEAGALQLATLAAARVSTGTSLPGGHIKGVLSFDVSFLAPQGKLTVKVNGAALKPIAASEPGVRRHISIPLDARAGGKARPLSRTGGELRFGLEGKPGAAVQISNLSIPGVFSDRIDADALSRWRADTSHGGSVDVVSIARLPMKIRLTPLAKPKGAPADAERISAAVLSTEDLDTTTDLDRGSLRVGGFPVRTERDKAGKQQPVCEARDVNDDKRKDLVCEVDVKGLGKAGKAELRLEAMTPFGWGISGADVVAAAAAAK